MVVSIVEEGSEDLEAYGEIPIAFDVGTAFRVELLRRLRPRSLLEDDEEPVREAEGIRLLKAGFHRPDRHLAGVRDQVLDEGAAGDRLLDSCGLVLLTADCLRIREPGHTLSRGGSVSD